MRGTQDDEERGSGEPTAFEGWCPDCALPSVIIEVGADGAGWATCTECEAGWVHRDEVDGAARLEQHWTAGRAAAAA